MRKAKLFVFNVLIQEDLRIALEKLRRKTGSRSRNATVVDILIQECLDYQCIEPTSKSVIDNEKEKEKYFALE